MYRQRLLYLALVGIIALLPMTSAAAPAPDPDAPSAADSIAELNIQWAQWAPANYLAELVKDYQTETGIKVNVLQESWGSYYTRVNNELTAGSCGFDAVLGDSQWLGEFAGRGHYAELTGLLNSTGLASSVTVPSLKYYGEYPSGSGRLWAFPAEGDAIGWAYRKDLFDDPAQKAGFKAKYGYDLAVPLTYAQLRDIAEWFYRPAADPPLYGVGIYTWGDGDGLTMGVQGAMFSYGGDWHNACNNVSGVVNSQRNVEAIQMYKALYSLGPPDNTNGYFPQMNDYFINGKVAIAMNYFSFLATLADPGSNPYASTTGFFANPAGPYGDRGASMGGQAISVNAHCAPERIQAAFDFIEWFGRDDVQAKWAQLGGYTSNKEVLASAPFLSAAPYHPAYAESMAVVKDFWNIPEYGQLLLSSQANLHALIVENLGTAQGRLDQIALDHQQVLTNAGYTQRCQQCVPLVIR